MSCVNSVKTNECTDGANARKLRATGTDLTTGEVIDCCLLMLFKFKSLALNIQHPKTKGFFILIHDWILGCVTKESSFYKYLHICLTAGALNKFVQTLSVFLGLIPKIPINKLQTICKKCKFCGISDSDAPVNCQLANVDGWFDGCESKM